MNLFAIVMWAHCLLTNDENERHEVSLVVPVRQCVIAFRMREQLEADCVPIRTYKSGWVIYTLVSRPE